MQSRTWSTAFPLLTLALIMESPAADDSGRWQLWKDGKPNGSWVGPATDERAGRLARATLSGFLNEFHKVELPASRNADGAGTWLVAGTPENNPALAALVSAGLRLTTRELGDEGFQLLTHEDAKSKFVILHGKTPRALKHACQELVFYQLFATNSEGWIDAPLDVVMRPEVAYRGIYMLPCWSAYDSLESWQRVLRFNSELTLNRVWFWLDGFPLAGHTGEYSLSDLADAAKVQRLIDLVDGEDMKFYIGGGWFNWHHEKAVGKNYAKGIAYYLDYFRAFTDFHGFYIEPTGEGSEIKDWRPEGDAMRELVRTVLRERPDFEFATAIGKFNNADYLKLMAELDPKRVSWWWCWGDPLRDKALDLYPSVLRWHVNMRMADYHGSLEPPGPSERALSGVVTSYDPGQGFGNRWNGWGKLGVDQPRNFHPHTLPYFAQQYFFRERCWNLNLTEAGFLVRLQRRLFDADAPADAARRYRQLSQFAFESVFRKSPAADQLAELQRFGSELNKRTWTPKMTDTIGRMDEALEQLRKLAEQ
jgi:hypothetical protein